METSVVVTDLAEWTRNTLETVKATALPAAGVRRRHEAWRVEPWATGGVGIVDEHDRGLAVAIGSYVADHIALNDPHAVIARCEADLAKLDEHADNGNGSCRTCAAWDDPIDPETGSRRTEDDIQATPAAHPCRTVRLIAWGLRHCAPGYPGGEEKP